MKENFLNDKALQKYPRESLPEIEKSDLDHLTIFQVIAKIEEVHKKIISQFKREQQADEEKDNSKSDLHLIYSQAIQTSRTILENLKKQLKENETVYSKIAENKNQSNKTDSTEIEFFNLFKKLPKELQKPILAYIDPDIAIATTTEVLQCAQKNCNFMSALPISNPMMQKIDSIQSQ